jgi:hypothetical protein
MFFSYVVFRAGGRPESVGQIQTDKSACIQITPE